MTTNPRVAPLSALRFEWRTANLYEQEAWIVLRMLLSKIGALVVALMMMSATPARAAAIPIINAGFETPSLMGTDFTDDVIPGWTGTISGAGFNFGIYNPPASVFPAEAPEGQNIAYIERGAIFQTLTEYLSLGAYTLTVQVGDSLVDPVSPFTIELRAGSTVLIQSSSPVPTNGTFTLVTINYEAVEGDPPLGEFLEIWLIDNDAGAATEPYFDSVQLNFEARPADFNGNGVVDGDDLTSWRTGFGIGSTHIQGDADGNRRVDGVDLLIWQRHLGIGAPPLVAVPEPGAFALLSMVCGGLALLRPRRR